MLVLCWDCDVRVRGMNYDGNKTTTPTNGGFRVGENIYS